MLQIFNKPPREQWTQLSTRPQVDTQSMEALVAQVFQQVKKKGDKALTKYTELFDGVKIEQFAFELASKETLEAKLEDAFIDAIATAAENINAFHKAQKRAEVRIETTPGISCWQRQTPIERVGLYIPAGSAPLFSTILMLAIPAKLAGCKELVLCSPPDKNGSIAIEIQYAARICGIDKIYTLGGVQAIAALTYGTDQVPRVDKIFGPGNQYVTAAKQFALRAGVSIDLPAGPSELLVYLDDINYAAFVAADLLSQAEHGPDSQVVLLAPSSDIIEAVNALLEKQIQQLPRKGIALKALNNGCGVVLSDLQECLAFINDYAPEHLIIISDLEDVMVEGITNAGSVFLGPYTPESLGDYASGTNHTLPTSGHAKRYGGVDLSSFQKPITYQKANRKGLDKLGPSVVTLARAEALEGHAQAVLVRLKQIKL